MLEDFLREFRRYRRVVGEAMTRLSDEQLNRIAWQGTSVEGACALSF